MILVDDSKRVKRNRKTTKSQSVTPSQSKPMSIKQIEQQYKDEWVIVEEVIRRS